MAGESHYIGCMHEQCPKCGNLLATCTCRVFLAEDKAFAVRRLYNDITNLTAAWAIAAYFPRKSMFGLAGWLWAVINSDPGMVAAMVLTESGTLANIKPSYCDAAGEPRYSVGDISRALGCGKREVAELERVFAGIEAGRKTEDILRVN
jgi:hypothetical protein